MGLKRNHTTELNTNCWQIDKLRKSGIITEEEFQKEKSEILKDLYFMAERFIMKPN